MATYSMMPEESMMLVSGNVVHFSQHPVFLSIQISHCFLTGATMPRQARIGAPGALHHMIIRGIERQKIFRSDFDRNLKNHNNIECPPLFYNGSLC
jgi:hypothetical protein